MADYVYLNHDDYRYRIPTKTLDSAEREKDGTWVKWGGDVARLLMEGEYDQESIMVIREMAAEAGAEAK